MPESIIYGCIRDTVFTDDVATSRQRRKTNAQALQSLPRVSHWPLLASEIFCSPTEAVIDERQHTDITHFGGAYKGMECEWADWIQQFESVLRGMYWVSAIVHLETEYNGKHTFVWEAKGDFHAPGADELSARCEWTREGVF